MHKHIAAGSHHNCVLAGDGIGERNRPCRRQGTRGTGFLSHVAQDARPPLNSANVRSPGRGVGIGPMSPENVELRHSESAAPANSRQPIDTPKRGRDRDAARGPGDAHLMHLVWRAS
jgi:hypothetical protein